MTGAPFEPHRLRIGQGFDVHPWGDTGPLILGGVSFPDHPALHGHSDGDAVSHACTDAVLGAAGLGDIGGLFPDTDPTLAGADSVALLAKAVDRARLDGWTVLNLDCTVVLDAPKIAPVRDEMQRRLTSVVGAPVSIKAKRTEGLESLAEGVRCHAVALLYRTSADDPTPDSESP